jgi:uncharacterized membrane protein YphA (DoxX/SURF4 family)
MIGDGTQGVTKETARPVGWWALAAARVVVGYMWYGQTLWKLPPDWGGPGGLRHWVEESGKYAVPWYRAFVNDVVLPHFGFFAPQVWLGETVIAISLFFGLFTRLGGTLCFVMGVNLYYANSKVPHEWYWSYVFIVLLGGIFAGTRAGRQFGLDRFLVPRFERLANEPGARGKIGTILLALT